MWPPAFLTTFAEITPEEAAKRGDYGAERYENIDFQTTIYVLRTLILCAMCMISYDSHFRIHSTP